MKAKQLFPLLLTMVILCACSSAPASAPAPSNSDPTQASAEVAAPAESAPADSTATPIAEAAAATEAPLPAAPEGYPATPEDVVFAFLSAYQENPNEMYGFLSKNLLGQMPSGGIAEYMHFDGTLEGFVFLSGTTSQDPAAAVVEAKLQINGIEARYLFHLVQQAGMWQVDGVEIL